MNIKQHFSEIVKGFDKKAISVFLIVPVCLSFIRYFGEPDFTIKFLFDIGLQGASHGLYDLIYSSADQRLAELTYWVFILTLFYLVVPALVVRLFFKEQLSAFGLSFKGVFTHWKWYVFMLLFMAPLVWIFSHTEGFQKKYPFYHISSAEGISTAFWCWEALYIFQFFSLEFFFRGFMVHGLKHIAGNYSVLIMTIPYCMIHFGKPLPETLAAIIAGVVLGYFSLIGRNIFPGVFIHSGVGVSMDVASLYQQGIIG